MKKIGMVILGFVAMQTSQGAGLLPKVLENAVPLVRAALQKPQFQQDCYVAAISVLQNQKSDTIYHQLYTLLNMKKTLHDPALYKQFSILYPHQVYGNPATIRTTRRVWDVVTLMDRAAFKWPDDEIDALESIRFRTNEDGCRYDDIYFTDPELANMVAQASLNSQTGLYDPLILQGEALVPLSQIHSGFASDFKKARGRVQRIVD